MAYWQRTKSGHVKIFDGTGKYVHKKNLYEFLDHEPDHNVESWVRDWGTKNEDGKKQAAPPPIDQGWAAEVADYCLDMTTRSKGRRSHKTMLDHRKALTEYIIPFFTQTHRMSDPNKWPEVSAKLLTWAQDEGATPHNILKANSALTAFWAYLRAKRAVLQGLGIAMRAPGLPDAETPLPRIIHPEEVLSYVRAVDNLMAPVRPPMTIQTLRTDLKLFALLGYFFSLRPQETFALRRQDFVAGSGAASILACKVMSSHALLLNEAERLYGRLGVEVHRQRTQGGKMEKPKAYSRGWVSCFDKRGAEALVRLLMLWEDKEALLFPHKPDRQYKWWGRYGIGAERPGHSFNPAEKKISLKDLRRSSLLWLGHFTTMDLVALRGHSRHKKEEMVLRYLRRPGERPDRADILDLDA